MGTNGAPGPSPWEHVLPMQLRAWKGLQLLVRALLTSGGPPGRPPEEGREEEGTEAEEAAGDPEASDEQVGLPGFRRLPRKLHPSLVSMLGPNSSALGRRV